MIALRVGSAELAVVVELRDARILRFALLLDGGLHVGQQGDHLQGRSYM